MIHISDLKPEHVGQWVRWRGGHPDHREEGRIKSWNERYVFVVFKCDDNWERFEDYAGQSCDPSNIDFMGRGEVPFSFQMRQREFKE